MEQPNHDATSSPSRDEPTNAASYERRDADSTGLQESTGARPDLLAIEQVETYVSNPLHVRYTTTEGGMSARCSYVGDAACEAFTTRVRRHVKEDDSIAPPRHEGYFKSTNLLRLVNKDFQLPERGYAMLLIDTAESIVGTEYHMFLRRTFLKQFDEFYKSGTSNDPVWLCGLFAILALGELYSNIPVRADHSEADIPGTSFFLQAMNLFEDLYEEPTISYIETILLLSYYSHALNRGNTAYTFAGLAMRLSLTLGLHRDLPEHLALPFEHEHRRRVWWTVYAFDRLCSLKLGHPIMLRDEDINVQLPSEDKLTARENEDLPDPKQMLASVSLARIAGYIVQDLYQPKRSSSMIENVQKILAKLKSFTDSLPEELSLDNIATAACPGRALASLHVHFNHANFSVSEPVNGPISSVTRALSDACINAATTCYTLLRRLWVNGQIVTLGGFDSQYLFSAATILTMNNFLEPGDTSQALAEGASSMLRVMGVNGNLSARGYSEQLLQLKRDLEEKKAAMELGAAHDAPETHHGGVANDAHMSSVTHSAAVDAGQVYVDTWSNSTRTQNNTEGTAILDAPGLNDFLTFECLDEFDFGDPGSQPLWWDSRGYP